MSIYVTIPDEHPRYLPGARLLALLAYPPKSATDRRWQNAERTICRALLGLMAQDAPELLDHPMPVVLAHAMAPATDLNAKLEEMQRVSRHRMAAAHAAFPLMREQSRLSQGNPVPLRQRKTLRGCYQKVAEQEYARRDWLEQTGQPATLRFPTDLNNFDKRVYRESLPVLHIAVAVAVWLDRSQKYYRQHPESVDASTPEDMAGPQASGYDLLRLPNDVAQIVRDARAYEQRVPPLKRGSLPPLVRLRYEDDV